MASHLSTIGLDAPDQAVLQGHLEAALENAEVIPAGRGFYYRWCSGTGAELWLQVSHEMSLVGLTPYFAGKARMPASITRRLEIPEGSPFDATYHAWAEPHGNDPEEGLFPFVFDVPDGLLLENVSLPHRSTVALSAFAHELEVFASQAAYDSSQSSEELKFSSRSFIPSGLFATGADDTRPPRPLAVFTGLVLETRSFVNPLTGQSFSWALVDTLGGTIDVVIDPALLQGPIVVGGVLSGQFWLCGRFSGRAPQQQEERGLIKRLWSRLGKSS